MLKSLLIKYSRVIKYIISGGTAAVVNIGSFSILNYFTDIWYIAASVIAFLLAFGVSFSLQKFWTFRDNQTATMKSQMVIYMLVSLTNLGITVLGMYLLVDIVYPGNLDVIISLDHWKVVSQIIVNGLIAFGSFFIYRTIFRINSQ